MACFLKRIQPCAFRVSAKASPGGTSYSPNLCILSKSPPVIWRMSGNSTMTNGCPVAEGDFEMYALGVLEGTEREMVKTHVRMCASCAQKLAEARGLIALLALATPLAEPSPSVKERLLRRIREW
jgi:hypothetical protein